jgi:hypothetical protein
VRQIDDTAAKPKIDKSAEQPGRQAVARQVDRRVRQQSPQRADWRTPTKYEQRFSEAVTLLCKGRKPPDEMVAKWIAHTDDNLQHFAADNGPVWAQGCGVLDAAAVIAGLPAEGAEHAA